jgi:hypothetical protein
MWGRWYWAIAANKALKMQSIWLKTLLPAFTSLVLAVLLVTTPPALGQSTAPSDTFTGLQIERVDVVITNPGPDAALNGRIADGVRRSVAIFPGARYSADRTYFALAQARRVPDVAKIDHSVSFGERGGLIVNVSVTIINAAEAGNVRGALVEGTGFPVLYDNDGTFVRARLEGVTLVYTNDNSWFGRPDLMLAGNPLAVGTPAGRGFTGWLETYVNAGLSGITPVTDNLYVYGAASVMATASAGRELFTDERRNYLAVEDAYAGFIVGQTTTAGNRYGLNMSAGRQRFQLANGFLIANTAGNGGDRGALQANARWAADMTVQAQLFWNDNKIEGFYVDPDELPIVDSQTQIAGVNLELKPAPGLMLGGSWLTVPRSTAGYFSSTGQAGTRKGLELWDVRFTWAPAVPGTSGPFFGGELAQQTNRNFAMRARAGYGEAGWSFPQSPWSPSFSYRLSYFSGDDPTTSRFERWDPLLSGGNGEQWVQGVNMFKVVQDSNSVAHRLQARIRPDKKVELVSQFWVFRADSLSNIGGNPALQVLSTKDYGQEVNLTAKWFASPRVYVHGQIGYTMAGSAISNALDRDASDWFSAMTFVRYAF